MAKFTIVKCAAWGPDANTTRSVWLRVMRVLKCWMLSQCGMRVVDKLALTNAVMVALGRDYEGDPPPLATCQRCRETAPR